MKQILISLLALTSMLPAIAQTRASSEGPVVSVIVGDTTRARDAEKEFRENAPRQANENGLPRFAIIGKENKYYLGIGAQFLGNAVYDFGDNMPSVYSFAPSSITIPAAGCGSALRFSALQSSIYINAVALPGTEDRVGLFFKAKLHDGEDYGFHLSHFYVTYRDFMVGYTSSIFTDGEAMPYTIDGEGPNGSVDLTVFTAAYTHAFGKSFSGGIGIDSPTADISTGHGVGTVTQRAPAIPLYLQYAFPESAGHVRLSGLIRPMQYRDQTDDTNRTPCGWGLQLSGYGKVAAPLTLYAAAVYGRGVSDYIQDDTDLGLDALPRSDRPGHLSLTRSFGITGGATVNFSDRLALNAVYSHAVNFFDDGVAVPSGQYRYGDYVAANLVYSISRIVGVGVEYDYGHRKAFDGESLHTNRLQALLSVTF